MLISAVCGRHGVDGNGLVECREQPQDQILTKCFQGQARAWAAKGEPDTLRTSSRNYVYREQACCQNLIIWWRILSLECKKKLLKGRSKE